MLAAIFSSLSVFAYTQPPAPRPSPVVPKRHPRHGNGETSEKSIAVAENVAFTMCVTRGNLKVNGWNRNEVRIFVKDGAKIGISVLQKDARTQNPVWIKVVGLQSIKPGNPGPSECIWGDNIEIDLPLKASVNIIGQETDTSIDTVKRANVKTNGGDISLRNVADGITARTWRGGVTVENSKGEIALESTTGNILVFEAEPSGIGDVFKAKTNSGVISLQHVAHRQIDVNSISGSVHFNGEILSGGTYGFSTSNGSIKLSIPQNSSCRFAASYGFGNFDSEIPMKILTEEVHSGPVKSIVGIFGNGRGDATLKLTTHSGSIAVKKQ